MFHTIELFMSISLEEYINLDKTIMSISKRLKTRYYQKNEIEKVSLCFKEKGIVIILKRFIKEYNYYKIVLKVNPKRIIKEKEYVEVAKESDLPEIKEGFRKIMKALMKDYNGDIFIYHNIDNYSVSRIDYCYNMYSKDSANILKLIRRGDIPKNFEPYLKYDEKSKRELMPRNSFYVIGKTVRINIYSKYDHMKNDKYFSEIDKTKALGIIRFEIQCGSQKIDNIKKSINAKDKKFSTLASTEISQKVLLYYLQKTMGIEDYYTLRSAKKIINNNNELPEKTKKEMTKILELVSKKRSIPKARESFPKGDRKFNGIIKDIRGLRINPVSIPVNWNIEYLCNPITEILK